MATEARDRKERDSIYASIQSSNRGRPAVNFDTPNGSYPKSHHDHTSLIHSENEEEEYTNHVREDITPPTPLATSRAHSPYTQHPTIDFDGLSWPSELFLRS